jgi:hypothetical protein
MAFVKASVVGAREILLVMAMAKRAAKEEMDCVGAGKTSWLEPRWRNKSDINNARREYETTIKDEDVLMKFYGKWENPVG